MMLYKYQERENINNYNYRKNDNRKHLSMTFLKKYPMTNFLVTASHISFLKWWTNEVKHLMYLTVTKICL